MRRSGWLWGSSASVCAFVGGVLGAWCWTVSTGQLVLVAALGTVSGSGCALVLLATAPTRRGGLTGRAPASDEGRSTGIDPRRPEPSPTRLPPPPRSVPSGGRLTTVGPETGTDLEPDVTFVAQCPRCAGFRLDITAAAPTAHQYSLGCRSCGHSWSWTPGTPWPPVVARPSLAEVVMPDNCH